MNNPERTCTHCGATVAADITRCPICGAHPDVGPLVVRRHATPAVPLRRFVAPAAAGAAVVVASAGLRLMRELLPRLRWRRRKAGPPAVAEPLRTGKVIAVRRRVWAVGDRNGARQWGAEETVWHKPAE